MNPLSAVRQLTAGSAPVSPFAAAGLRSVIVAGLLVTTAMVALLAASQLIDFGVFNLRLRAIDSDYRASVFGVTSLLAQVGVAAASVWRGRRAERHSWAWFVLGTLVAGLVVVRALTTFNATALAVPLTCVFLLVCWLTWGDPGPARNVVWTGLILMMASLLLHEVGLAADSSTASDYTWPYQILTVVKHGCELAGWAFVATGTVAGIVPRRGPTAEPPESLRLEMESVAG